MNIVVTGASRGIGREIALELGQNGNNLMINCAKRADELEGVSSILKGRGCGVLTCVGDVGDFGVCKGMVDAAVAEFGSVDVLINNAGISWVGLLQDMTKDEWDTIWNVNVSSVFCCCKAVLPHMIAAKSGKIINISSVWGNVGASCEVAYSATKGAVNSFTKALAKEVAPSGIQVNAIACGAIDTDMNSHLSATDKAELSEEIPVGRFGTPSEIARMVKLLTEAPSYLTGQIITADGGWT